MPLPLWYPLAERDEQFVLIDLSEQFLGAYEYGALRFAMPIASGNGGNETPVGDFRITAAHGSHQSCLYTLEGTSRSYPMNHALRFHVNLAGGVVLDSRSRFARLSRLPRLHRPL